MNTVLIGLTPAAALSAPLLAPATSDAVVAPSPATALSYRSAFADYKPWRDVERGEWRQLNDNLSPAIGKQGRREGRAGAPALAHTKASAPASPAAHQGHAIHGRQP